MMFRPDSNMRSYFLPAGDFYPDEEAMGMLFLAITILLRELV
jgi:hypothetical protein